MECPPYGVRFYRDGRRPMVARLKAPLREGGWRRQAAGGERATLKLVFVSDTARRTLGATTG